MKKIALLFAVFASMNLTAQVSPAFNDAFEIVNRDKNGIYIKYPQKQHPITLPSSQMKEDLDTLFFWTEVPFSSVVVVGQQHIYGFINLTWITPNLGYVMIDENDEYTVAAQMHQSQNIYWIFEENYSISQTDTLTFHTMDATLNIWIEPVNQNNQPFSQLSGFDLTDIYVLIPSGEGYYALQFYHNLGSVTRFSPLSSDNIILCSSLFYDVDTENYGCFVEFPSIAGLSHDMIFVNQPENFVQTHLKMNFTTDPVDEAFLGFATAIYFKYYDGAFFGFGGGMLPEIEPQNWDGELFMISQEHDDFKTMASIQALTKKGGTYYTDCWSAWMEEMNDSITGFWSFYPPHNLYFSGTSDTLMYGESPTTFWYDWYNNSPVNLILAQGSAYGILWERIKPRPNMSDYKVKDAAGNILYEYQGSGIISYGVSQPGLYSVEISNYSSPLLNGDGNTFLNVNVNMGSSDANPPSITPVQFRDANGKPAYQFGAGEPLNLFFAAADFQEHYDSGGEIKLITYQPILDDSTKVWLKPSESNLWEEIEIEKYFEDTICGMYYKSDLSPYTNLDSCTLDLKIKIRDLNENTAEYIIKPALIIHDLASGSKTNFAEQPAITVYPNPTSSNVNIQWTSNTGMSWITIFDSEGRLVFSKRSKSTISKEQQFIWDLRNQKGNQVDKGIYLIQINTGGIKKSIKLLVK